MSQYISKERMNTLGKEIEHVIGPDKEYFLMVVDKRYKGKIFQYIKNVPMNYFLQCIMDFVMRIQEGGILDTPTDN